MNHQHQRPPVEADACTPNGFATLVQLIAHYLSVHFEGTGRDENGNPTGITGIRTQLVAIDDQGKPLAAGSEAPILPDIYVAWDPQSKEALALFNSTLKHSAELPKSDCEVCGKPKTSPFPMCMNCAVNFAKTSIRTDAGIPFMKKRPTGVN